MLRTYIRSQKHFVHFPIEIRFVNGDDALLTPSNNVPCVWIGIIMYKPYGIDPPYKQYFFQFEKDMEKLDGRPHWAKDFHWTAASGQFARSYSNWQKFLSVRERYDPKRVFENEWSKRIFGTEKFRGSLNHSTQTSSSSKTYGSVQSGYLCEHPAEKLSYVDSCLKLQSIPTSDSPPTFII